MPPFRIIIASLFVATLLPTGCDRSKQTDLSKNLSAKAETAASDSARSTRAHEHLERPADRRKLADEKLAAVKQRLAVTKKFTPEIVDSLQRLRSEAPQHRPTLDLLTSAYVKLEDWNALADLLQTNPSGNQTTKEQLQLAKVLVKAQRFREAFDLSSQVMQMADPPTEVESAWVAAYSAFHAGNPSQAAAIFDANFARLIENGRLNAYVIRALIHFQEGELPEAEALLRTLLEKDPSRIQANHALGRVLVASGDVDGGRQYMERATELRDQLTRKEQQGLRLSAMSQSLRAAWERKDFDACERFITGMLAEANTQQQSQLYQQLAALRAAQGRQQEAMEAFEKAKQLSEGMQP